MTQTNLEKWIETAEARHICETAMSERMPAKPRRRHPHFRAVIIWVPALIGEMFSIPHHRHG